MKNSCSKALLESALEGSLPANDEVSLHRHLEECEQCSAALERMAGGPAWCQEAASLLARDELDAATGPTRDAWSEVDFTVEHLEPSDEPSALGRLGGYDVLEIIGHGGMGVVLKGFDRELKRSVAIKVLAPHLAQSSLAKKRFAREAQAAAAVVHPNVLAIHQVHASGRLPFLVMPLVAGESLAERLTDQGTLELKEILRIGMQAAAGLAAAHEQGLVHRDVKPANILLEKGVERAVLTDFGLACAADDVTLTRWGIVAGTPQYMSPEQARGEPLDGRSDLFSLGCVLYEMSTGISPFRADSVMATMRRLVDDAPQSMASINPELPPWFIAIVEKLLQKDPSRRFNSAKEVSELLEGCLAHVQQPANVILPAALSAVKPAALARVFASRRRFARWFGTITALVLLGIGGIGAFMMATAEQSEITGEWTGDDWGKVVLKQTAPAEYLGTYTDTFGKELGNIELKWSRIERRYNGTWSEGKDRLGKISVHQVGDEIRGAWTTNRKSEINPGTPALADLLWVRPNSNSGGQETSKNLTFGPAIERRLNDLPLGSSFLNLETGERFSPEVREFEKAMKWANANGADIIACGDSSGWGLRIIGGMAVQPATWDASPEDVVQAIANMEHGLKKYQRDIPGFQDPRAVGFSNLWFTRYEKSSTYFIKTRNGTLGTLQINRLKDYPSGVEVRYKLLATETAKLQRDLPTGAESMDSSLSRSISKFNRAAAEDSIGKVQPPLTVNEVVTALRWMLETQQDDRFNKSELEQLRSVVETRVLPCGSQLNVTSTIKGVDGEQLQAWQIQLSMPSADGKTSMHLIRRQILGELNSQGKLISLPEMKSATAENDATPLAAAVNAFNACSNTICDVRQKPLTEEEVVAAIRWWKTQRNDAPVTNHEFATFQKIADERQFPPGVDFEVNPEFRLANGNTFFIWSVRIKMPRASKLGSTYAYIIRQQYVDSHDANDSDIAWGAADSDGLQVGVVVEPRDTLFVTGERATPIFYYRNTGNQVLNVSFPRLMTDSYYEKLIATDATGKEIPIEQNQEPQGPVGWVQLPLASGAEHEVRGLPIVLGDADRGSAETVIRAAAGQKVRLRFELPNPRENKAPPLPTGELLISIK